MTSKDKPEPFPAGTRQAWEEAARDELQGADPWQKLTREVHGIPIRPYYSIEDAPATPFRLEAAGSAHLGPRTWYNCPRVIVSDPIEGNGEALEHLRQGADGIFFELRTPVDFKKLLADIEWPICALYFLPKTEAEASAKALSEYLNSFQGAARGAWYGAVQVDSPTDRSFHTMGYIIPATPTPVETLVEHLSLIYTARREMPNNTAQAIAIQLEIGTDFFFEIARLRAIRKVWEKLPGTAALHIHACSSPWTPEAYAPHANLLKATTAAMAGILGGADALTIDPEAHDQLMQRRVARNVAILLREESRFAKVADPLAGAYFIDHLTEAISGKIWLSMNDRLAS